jgi:hypothetical protein
MATREHRSPLLHGLVSCSYPFGGEPGLAAAGALDGRPAGDELGEEDAEGVDVALVGQLVRAQVLRLHVPGGALRRRRVGARARAGARGRGRHPQQPEAGYLRRQRVGQQHHRRPDASMDDRMLCNSQIRSREFQTPETGGLMQIIGSRLLIAIQIRGSFGKRRGFSANNRIATISRDPN